MNHNSAFRIEHDLLGDAQVPHTAYYGIQTQRAKENFNITGVAISHFPQLVNALAMVKMAAAKANLEVGVLSQHHHDAIVAACQEIIEGQWHDQFIVDLIQGGAGTSTNMNANEVIANRGLEILGYAKGNYAQLHPNNHVNLAQSTNDAYPTAVRLAVIFASQPLIDAITDLVEALQRKGDEFDDVLKMGRTQMQDAVPMTLGQEFRAFAHTLAEDIDRLREAAKLLAEVNLGGTAIGTGINAHPDYADAAIRHLTDIAKVEMKSASDKVEATVDMGAFVLYSGILRRIAVKLSKICNDLRLLSSGPRCGFNEINLPAMQPGSSIMPGKVNPVIPEAVNQTAFQVIGNDLAVTMAAEAGQLQLNAMEPLITYNLLNSTKMLSDAMAMLTTRCVVGITANKDHCQQLVNNSLALATLLNPYIGYENTTRLAKTALQTGQGIVELVLEEGLLTQEQLDRLLDPEVMLKPSIAQLG
ncbi:fumarate lyase [Ferrimonas balearica DSM 9799]|uniref:Fumarate lyase n=1 Tax=Ferrimonas balearica (strain DSM 9799 / CCM 4581 / KCTC 23876 / PAT) TaxID=550540 RepID=E1SNJ3_FERBD|nr:aspartate ammonia-lyase [Ferrimonas balearica]ADN75677.1 fumarate lyase [Ferrimonas balearica DSM 9799]MBW3138576.1 aspartate ammonia-lyase [Ferrimonas balearica]MBW3163835.1 aspartate ammonia-lyase [Ferrimonas balearica]MBY5979345.1 aspartate ammonia-lyase [Ferrimonas balearica]MBY6096874.1 aspartate ammonia-lyase [Ferrimonas balearica]